MAVNTEITCPDCGESFPWDIAHMCPDLKHLRSAMHGKEVPADVDTANEMRIEALRQAVEYGKSRDQTSLNDVVFYAGKFFKFLMGESQ